MGRPCYLCIVAQPILMKPFLRNKCCSALNWSSQPSLLGIQYLCTFSLFSCPGESTFIIVLKMTSAAEPNASLQRMQHAPARAIHGVYPRGGHLGSFQIKMLINIEKPCKVSRHIAGATALSLPPSLCLPAYKTLQKHRQGHM